MIFASDNWASVTPAVAGKLAAAMADMAPGYGADRWTAAAEAAIAEWFEHDVAVFFVATGSAANSLALAHASRPGGVAFCHADAHLAADEAGAPSFLGGGLVVERLPGALGRIDAEAFRERLALYPDGVVHHGQPVALSITNVTEYGTCYTPAEVAALAEIAKRRGLTVHMDGARFANALAFLGSTPADLTWRAGVDVLSLGFTKAGCWCAEAVVFFGAGRATDFAYRRKAAGHLFSKSRFVAAQFLAMLEGDHWREVAGRANRLAAELGERVAATGRGQPAWPSESNEVFLHLDAAAAQRLRGEGAAFYGWAARELRTADRPPAGRELGRFVLSFASTEADIAAFAERLAQS